MRWATGLALTLAIGASAQAATFRWTTGYGQGTVEAIIRNAQGADLNIYCPWGETPGMFFKSKTVKPAAKQMVDVAIVVDGKSHPFRFAEIQFQAKDAASRSPFDDSRHPLPMCFVCGPARARRWSPHSLG